jgi:hypothetical protein
MVSFLNTDFGHFLFVSSRFIVANGESSLVRTVYTKADLGASKQSGPNAGDVK